MFAAGLGFDAEVIERVEAQRARGRRSSGALYVREAVSAFLLGRERRRPAMTLRLPGEPALEDLFLCLVSNVSPWTYLGARPVNPSPEASFDTGLDVFAMGPTGAVAMLRTLRQTLVRRPDARGRGVHRRHDLEELTLTADRPLGLAARRRPPGAGDRAARAARAGRAPRRGLSRRFGDQGRIPSLTMRRTCQRLGPACGSVEWRT